MKLELKHLAPYLPYGLKIIFKGAKNKLEYEKNFDREIKFKNEKLIDKIGEIRKIIIRKNYIICHVGKYGFYLKSCLLNEIKPILRPLSDLTKEIEINNKKFVPIKDLTLNIDEYKEDKKEDYCFRIYNTWHKVNQLPYFKIEYLLKLHFDVFGLIENNIAIDINELDKQ